MSTATLPSNTRTENLQRSQDTLVEAQAKLAEVDLRSLQGESRQHVKLARTCVSDALACVKKEKAQEVHRLLVS